MVRAIQRNSCNAVESQYGATSEFKRKQTENTRLGTKTRQRNVGPYNAHMALS
jgi:hypothetical protein